MSSLAKEVVKLWKDGIEENKKKRKRDDEDVKKEEGVKKVKAEGKCTVLDCFAGVSLRVMDDIWQWS